MSLEIFEMKDSRVDSDRISSIVMLGVDEWQANYVLKYVTCYTKCINVYKMEK